MAEFMEITRMSNLWPSGWSSPALIRDEPYSLWVEGDVSLLQRQSSAFAVIGSRACTAYGAHVASDLGHNLAQQGKIVVSGLAFGIDAAAHRGTLAAGGQTIAVLAAGLDSTYPSVHRDLRQSIVDSGGLIVSEQPPGTAPRAATFLARNRLIASLSRAMIVVEASLQSGSMNAVKEATLLEHPIFAVPGPVTSITSSGPHQLIRDGVARILPDPNELTEVLSA